MNKIGLSPKASRDWCTSCLHKADVNKNTIEAILGHSPMSMTGVYRSVDIETKRSVIDLLY